MRLAIPDIGTKLKLTKEWDFLIYPEDRNKTLASILGYEIKSIKDRVYKDYFIKTKDCITKPSQSGMLSSECYHLVESKISCTLPVDTLLKVDRIYIRKGMEGFSSITFKVEGGKFDKCRFWVKLKYANQIEFDLPKQDIRYKFDKPIDKPIGSVFSLPLLEKYSVGNNLVSMIPLNVYVNGNTNKVQIKQQLKYRKITSKELKERNLPNHLYDKLAVIEEKKYIGFNKQESKVLFNANTFTTSKTKMKKYCNEKY